VAQIATSRKANPKEADMTTSADRATMAHALTHIFARAPETKRAPLALAAISEAGLFEGYASLFDVADLGRDVVKKGAFAACLKKRGADAIKMLWQHDPAEPIGVWLAIEEDTIGLKVRGRLNLAVARARETLSLMREGAVDGLSIGFRAERATQDRKTGLRLLQRLELWEISIVTFPMLPQARVTAVKLARSDRDRQFRDGVTQCAMARYNLAGMRLDTKLTGVGRWLERRFDPGQPRDEAGRWTNETSGSGSPASLVAQIAEGALSATFGALGGVAAIETGTQAALDQCEA
jgi:uncharacterized protein